jgi:predicted nuclease of predicted toxin-antitoxin system
MKFKLDENLSRHLKALLELEGHDVSTVLDEGLSGKPDAAVGEAARAEDRILLTLDLDFADVRKFPPGTHPGIVLFRPAGMGPGSVQQFVLGFLHSADLGEASGAIVIVETQRVRIRRPAEI